MDPEDTYQDLVQRMAKAAAHPVETRPGWRDRLYFLRPTKTKIGAAIFLIGATASIISGRIFLDRLENTVRRSEENSSLPYENLEKAAIRAGKPRELVYDPAMDYSSIGVISGLVLMGGGAIFGTIKPQERWPYGQENRRQRI